MGIADAILDLVSSGTTLKENNLKEIEGGVVLESQKPNYKSSTFAFVQFADEESRKKAIQYIHGKWIDGRRISVGIAKYQKTMRREVAEGKRMMGNKSDKQEKTQIGKKAESVRSLRDGRSYKDVVNNGLNAIREQVSGEKLEGIMKHSYEQDSIKEALKIEGLGFEISKWGYAWNACIITFNTIEELTYNEAFMEKLTGRWGKFICFNEESKSRSDLSVAKVLLRVESPFDIHDTVAIGSYGRSFKVKLSLGSVLKKPDELKGKTEEKFSKILHNDYVMSMQGDRHRPTLATINREISEDARHKVLSWLNDKKNSGVNGVNRGQVPSSKSNEEIANCELSVFIENMSNQNRNHVGLGLRETFDPEDKAQSDEIGVDFSPIRKIIPTGSAFNPKWVGEKTNTGRFMPQPNNISVNHREVADEGAVMLVKEKKGGEKEMSNSEQDVDMDKEQHVGLRSQEENDAVNSLNSNDFERQILCSTKGWLKEA
ncbi:hypothetical protein F3Y22_tig00110339pilonHSYRG00288 [Hibiscus syriacus]|uniref:ATP phosphoribosyltransferase n=1 Tax=Hibiscus syriacus TaxID=106335 RepID=A0A6A3AV11_HIBSY|nr:hypothetical protein F3Y22_tig00110339pilonHSYRG00288 [Hibiscus syriacus]